MTGPELLDLVVRPLVREPSAVEALLGLLAVLVVLVTVRGLRTPRPLGDPDDPRSAIVESSRLRSRTRLPAWLGVLALLVGAAGHAADLGVLLGAAGNLGPGPETSAYSMLVFRWSGALLAGTAVALLGFLGSWLLAARRPLLPDDDRPPRGRTAEPD